ncbi:MULTISPECIES: long-chain-fatty-acid--CoA ligase [unclassified Sphingomonas]|uniref:long-chain-fatty-acid--CoA ligase n=1 Tax=unclassified Sphingomonas TaxID=196159 RepID=UPI00070041A8|nr:MULTISPECIES: long-chain fatty acid--CoA ligase [unclassified Sphingomonas]KQM61327.1 dicarboxylate--CoA ligase PimA [Sphingomonas sp. Leaf16]KQN12422.1 dicarboxylate--CoA ligase PimA [Sphingomonas sp. Leaf29]KQN18903.1 dicarboxylate--CoA ligase PimA [Sphingomonas sp. Leaf32]
MSRAAPVLDRYAHPVAWETPLPPMSMVTLFEESAARRGDAPLIDFLGRHYSYAETKNGADRVACGLAAMGYGPGDRIGLFLPNVPHYVAAYYGILKLGATVVNFSPLYTAQELAAQVEDSGTKLLFTLSASALLPTALKVLETSSLERLIVGSVAGALPPAKSLFYRWFRSQEVTPRPDDPRVTAFSALIANDGGCSTPTIDPERDLALIQYTGGTTGSPKGAMLSHANLSANARQVAWLDPDGPDACERIIGALPMFHVFANTCVLHRTVVTGGEIVMLPRFDAGQVLAAITRTRATAMPGVPTMYRALLDHPRLAATDFSSLRFCISGGAPMPPELKERFEAATRATLVEGYGLSESSGVVSCNPYAGPQQAGSIGQPIAQTRVRLVDKEDPTRPAAEGEPGEIVVAGPQIMGGYWHRPDTDDTTFCVDAEGTKWLRTGDVGTIDADGFVRIVDRLKDMIAVGGFKVFPSEIERILYHHPAIREALVVGLPNDYRGESPHAYVTLADDADVTGEALKAWLNPQLGKHERVDEVVVRLTLPKTMIGKLSRKDLIAEVMAERG